MFQYRMYNGWISDLLTVPRAHAAWPSTDIDAALLDDHRNTYALLHHLGIQGVCLWGLLVSREWPVEVE